MPERAVAGTPAATKIPSYKVHTGHSVRSKCSNRRRALSTNYSSCSARCAARALGAHARIGPSTCARTAHERVHGSAAAGAAAAAQLFRSFREASISSARRREWRDPASCLVCHDRPRPGSLDTPSIPGALCIRTTGRQREKRPREKSHGERERRRER